MIDTDAPYYRSENGRTVVYGDEWWAVERSRADDKKCRRGEHTVVMWGISDGHYVARCSCAAMRVEKYGPWLRDRNPRYTTSPWWYRAFWAAVLLLGWAAVLAVGFFVWSPLLPWFLAYPVEFGTGWLIGSVGTRLYFRFHPW